MFYITHQISTGASQVALVVKKAPANAGDVRIVGSINGLERSPWRMKWQPSLVSLSGKSHGEEPGKLQSMSMG